MSINNIKSIEFDINESKIFGIKSGILWGSTNINYMNSTFKEQKVQFPLLYISKPRCVSEEDFRKLLNRLEIHLKSK